MESQFKKIIDMLDKRHPFVYIDIGAMGGIQRKWLPFADHMQTIGFEPDPREFKNLVDTGHMRYFNYALDKRSEDLAYYITKGHGKSSVFKPNIDLLSDFEDVERFDVVGEEIVPAARVKALDFLMKENLVNDADFIKIDTQGSELRIMEGAGAILRKIFGAQIEVEFVEMYKGQPLFRDVDGYLDSKGFALMDIKRHYWKRKDFYKYRGKGQLIFGDALYFKKIDIFCGEICAGSSGDPVYAKAKILKGVLICVVYKMFDYALSLAKSGLLHGRIDKDEHARISGLIKKCAQKGIPSRINLWKVYGALNSLLQKFKPASGWAEADGFIGNVEDV